MAAGLFSLITSLGIITRLAQVTRTAKLLMFYENMVIAGTIAGVLLWIYVPKFSLNGIFGAIGGTIFGFLAGIYIGCLIGAVAEILDAIPIFFRRLSIGHVSFIIIIMLAAGKVIGVFLQFILNTG